MTGAQRPLIMLHGFAQTPASWSAVRELLPAGRLTLALELPGHGGAGSGDPAPTPEAVRALVADAVRAAGAPAVVWGYSQGARIAYDLVLHEPSLVSALVVESGRPGIDDPAERAWRRRSDLELSRQIESEPIERFVEFWERVPALGEQSQELIEQQRAGRLSHEPAALASALRGIGQAAYEPMWKRLGEIAVPVLLLTGADDPQYVAHAERAAGLIEHARHVTLPGCGHAVHMSDPQSAAAAVEAFLASAGLA